MKELDLEWAKYFITKYEEERDVIVRRDKNEIDGLLRKLMYEIDFEYDKEDLDDIVDQLLDEI